MTSARSGPSDGRTEIVGAWLERYGAAGADLENCSSTEALFLLAALRLSLRSGSRSPELDHAARSWGSQFSDPVEVLLALSALREVVVGSAGEPPDTWNADWLPVAPDQFDPVAQQLMLGAVDAASGNLRIEARTDPLTGCANRLALHEDLRRAVAGAARSGLDLSLAVVDLDGLKLINDTSGHDAGDRTLRALVTGLRAVMRDADTLYRSGGDEFVVIAPFTDAAGVTAMLQRAAKAGSPRFSWGVANLNTVGPGVVTQPELLVSVADADLYLQRGHERRALATVGTAWAASRVVSSMASPARRPQPTPRSVPASLWQSTRSHAAAVTLVAGLILVAAGSAFALTGTTGHQPAQGRSASVGPSGSVGSRPHELVLRPTHRRSVTASSVPSVTTTSPPAHKTAGSIPSGGSSSVSPPSVVTAWTAVAPAGTNRRTVATTSPSSGFANRPHVASRPPRSWWGKTWHFPFPPALGSSRWHHHGHRRGDRWSQHGLVSRPGTHLFVFETLLIAGPRWRW